MAASHSGTHVTLAVVSTYFNLNHSKYRLANYHAFRAALDAAGVASLTLEWSRDGTGFELPVDDSIVRIQGGDFIWQAERLLNHGMRSLPAEFDKVAWIDADIIFEQQDWPEKIEQALDRWPLIQAFSLARMMPTPDEPQVPFMEVPGSIYCRDNQVKWPDGSGRLGHCGYAWAARREVIEKVGLYDAVPVGGGDKNKLFALLNQLDQQQMVERQNQAMRQHYQDWARQLLQICNGQSGYAELSVHHLWHGSLESRHYRERHAIPLFHNFNPWEDISLGDSGAWLWSSDKPALHREVEAYLTSFGE
jgi:hypothetical protein